MHARTMPLVPATHATACLLVEPASILFCPSVPRVVPLHVDIGFLCACALRAHLVQRVEGTKQYQAKLSKVDLLDRGWGMGASWRCATSAVASASITLWANMSSSRTPMLVALAMQAAVLLIRTCCCLWTRVRLQLASLRFCSARDRMQADCCIG
jgi:hypothetical protein